LGIIDFSLAPHYRSDNPESPLIEEVAAYFVEHDIPHQCLRDGDVIVYRGTSPVLCSLEDGNECHLNLDKS
jgi:dipeptidase E